MDNSMYPPTKELEERKSIDRAKRNATKALEHTRSASKTASSGLIALLARRQGRSVEDFAEGIDEDTIRRTKYPVIVQENDDGTLTFKHPIVVPDKELVHAPTTPGSKRDEERGGINVHH